MNHDSHEFILEFSTVANNYTISNIATLYLYVLNWQASW